MEGATSSVELASEGVQREFSAAKAEMKAALLAHSRGRTDTAAEKQLDLYQDHTNGVLVKALLERGVKRDEQERAVSADFFVQNLTTTMWKSLQRHILKTAPVPLSVSFDGLGIDEWGSPSSPEHHAAISKNGCQKLGANSTGHEDSELPARKRPRHLTVEREAAGAEDTVKDHSFASMGMTNKMSFDRTASNGETEPEGSSNSENDKSKGKVLGSENEESGRCRAKHLVPHDFEEDKLLTERLWAHTKVKVAHDEGLGVFAKWHLENDKRSQRLQFVFHQAFLQLRDWAEDLRQGLKVSLVDYILWRQEKSLRQMAGPADMVLIERLRVEGDAAITNNQVELGREA